MSCLSGMKTRSIKVGAVRDGRVRVRNDCARLAGYEKSIHAARTGEFLIIYRIRYGLFKRTLARALGTGSLYAAEDMKTYGAWPWPMRRSISASASL